MMRIGIVGLGLIGGSVAKAFKKYTDYEVLGFDLKQEVMDKAISCNAIDAGLDGRIGECDIIVLGLYPEAAVDFVRKNAVYINKDTIVTDVGGVKEKVCGGIYPIAEEYGFTFIGMHPMAGIEKFGFDYSKADMFQNASLIMTPFENTLPEKIEFLKNAFMKLGFSRVCKASPQEHDKLIAYTSQLAHVLSCCYIKSPSAMSAGGFSAGSFRDMTRVAHLNETMWTELFMENSENLAAETELLAHSLEEFAQALRKKDANEIFRLLKEGREKKDFVDEHM